MKKFWPWCGALLLASLSLLAPGTAQACAACYGQSDSPLAAGMNWAIMSLLGIIVLVLGGVAAFFIFLARRTAARAATQGAAQLRQARVAAGTSGRGRWSTASFDRQIRPLTATAPVRPSCSSATPGPLDRASRKQRQR
jgi:hypothetical protein